MARSDLIGNEVCGASIKQIAQSAFSPISCLIDLEAIRLGKEFLMSDQFPIVVQPFIRPNDAACEEYCTVVFRLQGGRSAMVWFLAELSQHFEGSGTAEIVKFEVGDHLRNRR